MPFPSVSVSIYHGLSAGRLASIGARMAEQDQTQDQLRDYIRVDKAPVNLKQWVTCGDLADATYVYGEQLQDGQISDHPHRLEEALHRIGVDQQLFIPVASIFTKSPKKKAYNFAGYVAHPKDDPTSLYFSWRGTILKEEWVADADVNLQPVPWDNEQMAHGGFLGLYEDAVYRKPNGPNLGLVDLLMQHTGNGKLKAKVFATGHSLGGALATLCAYHIKIGPAFQQYVADVTLVTFSGPRVASLELVRKLDKTLPKHVRIFTDGDLVPLVPLYTGDRPQDTGYKSVGLASSGCKSLGPQDTSYKSVGPQRTKRNRMEELDDLYEQPNRMEELDDLYKKMEKIETDRNRRELELNEMTGSAPQEYSGRLCYGAIEPRVRRFRLSLGDVFIWAPVLQSLLRQAGQAVITGRKASYHHAGFAVYLRTTALDEKLYDFISWNIGNHHSLKLILHLLQPDDATRRKRLSEEFGILGGFLGGGGSRTGPGGKRSSDSGSSSGKEGKRPRSQGSDVEQL